MTALLIPRFESYRKLPVETMAIIGADAMTDGRVETLMFMHDDASLLPPSEPPGRLDSLNACVIYVREFLKYHPGCGLMGFGGGIAFGHPDIYKTPYDHNQLARYDFVSNMREAESHGRRITSPTQVAALDGFALIIRRELYEEMGGWEACLDDGVHFHMYDAWVSCMAARLGWETWVLPLPCHHEGGGTSVKRSDEYELLVRAAGYRDGQDLYDKAHRRIYEEFRDVLPIRTDR